MKNGYSFCESCGLETFIIGGLCRICRFGYTTKEILSSEEYTAALKEFRGITDRPVTIFLYSIYSKGISLKGRIKVLDYEDAADLQEKGIGSIVFACFNEDILVKKVEFCDGCGCSPCDCDWGNHE